MERAPDQAREFGHGFGIVPSLQLFRIRIQKPRCGTIDDGDIPVAVETNHAGADAGEHSFGKAAALIELLVGMNEFVAARIELRRHAIEGAPQHAHLVVAAVDLDLRFQIAARDALRRADQARHRPYKRVCGPQPEPDCREQNEQHGANGEQQQLFEPQSPNILPPCREQEAHGGPFDDPVPPTVQQMNDDRDRRGPGQRRQSGERRSEQHGQRGQVHCILYAK